MESVNGELLQQYCRTCFSNDFMNFFDIFSKHNDISIAELIFSNTSIKIDESVNFLPRNICKNCYECVIQFEEFKKKALLINEELKNYMKNYLNGTDLVTTDIKTEGSSSTGVNICDYENTCMSYDFHNNEHSLSTFKSNCKPFMCDVCKVVFDKKSQLKKHLKKDHLMKWFDCTKQITNKNFEALVDKLSKSEDELEHMCKFHNDNFQTIQGLSPNNLMCTKCCKTLKKNSHSKRHKVAHDEGSRYEGIEPKIQDFQNHGHTFVHKLFICDICKECFIKKSQLKVHLENHQTNLFNGSEPIEDQHLKADDIIQVKSEIESELKCKYCDGGFKTIQALSAHMRKHSDKRNLTCTKCCKTFKKISHLKRHEVVHQDKFSCKYCVQEFLDKNEYKTHMSWHDECGNEVCPVCNKKFLTLDNLRGHLKLHQENSQHLCQSCGKQFSSKGNLMQHVKRHFGEKYFCCTLCPERFVSKGELKFHMVVHTKEKRYLCQQCGAKFTRMSTLNQHYLRHRRIKAYKCETCLLSFFTRNNLLRHQRRHTGERPYKCTLCDKAYAQSCDLLKHKKKHFGERIYKCATCDADFKFKTELRDHMSEHYVKDLFTEKELAEVQNNNNCMRETSDAVN